MACYHNKFIYKGSSNIQNGLYIVAFDADNGDTDAFLGMDNIYGDRYDGTSRYDYGARYNTVATITITMVKQDASNMSVLEFRNIARWLTGAKMSSWLDLYKADEIGNDVIDYSFLCKCIELNQYKLDGRVIGVTAKFESVSPFAYSPIQTVSAQLTGSETAIHLANHTDDLYSFVYPTVVFENSADYSLSIYNEATDETTSIIKLGVDEVVTMNSNQIIFSSIENKIFGSTFNFTWLRLAPGSNNLTVSGIGNLTISYRYPMKVGDCIVDINSLNGYDCGTCNHVIATDEEVKNVFNSSYEEIFGGEH
jgi:hypothetical protein